MKKIIVDFDETVNSANFPDGTVHFVNQPELLEIIKGTKPNEIKTRIDQLKAIGITDGDVIKILREGL